MTTLDQQQTAEVLRSDLGHVRVLTLNRPEKLNALSPDGHGLFARELRAFRDDDDAWVLVVTGAGRAFSTGLDLSRAPNMIGRLPATLNGPDGLEIWKPIIAALHGHVAGGGCETALACDIRIAAEDTKIGLTEVRRGLIPGAGGIQRLVRHLAFGDALKILFTGEWVSPQEALRIGLVQEVVPAGQDLERAVELAEQICTNGPLAVRAVKEAAYRGHDLPLRHALVQDQLISLRNRQNDDAREGVRAFVEKRPARFTAT
ncbi:crotonase [Pseudonocardia sulfidoxydans NBRC 16205]|uniref:Crotonase n=1 Tax=Pseudonocardia sulfidoxydans NBRC 16205 TaxID=1223511 RepID=A0A511DJC9_9PSEU|nr:enoyl-CoA hydratase-related protein [Pseudonocardia sulfidoxydans]GEL23138.1 crotonase [Pseudonocardia sulfidoxydans NBRC 16205]